MNPVLVNKIKDGTIVDVRTQEEFYGGHVKGSVNIPLQEISNRLEEIKAIHPPLILCCASGNRSGQAYRYLAQMGIDCYNGGAWSDIHELSSR